MTDRGRSSNRDDSGTRPARAPNANPSAAHTADTPKAPASRYRRVPPALVGRVARTFCATTNSASLIDFGCATAFKITHSPPDSTDEPPHRWHGRYAADSTPAYPYTADSPGSPPPSATSTSHRCDADSAPDRQSHPGGVVQPPSAVAPRCRSYRSGGSEAVRRGARWP
jgi:hypothetical protein